MRAKGWMRLWIVLTLIGVPVAAGWQVESQSKWWSKLDELTMKLCVDAEFSNPSHPDAIECAKKQGAYRPLYERDRMSIGAYWGEYLGVTFFLDCLLTALLIGAFHVVRWIGRGSTGVR
jgi:hypothetical protein